MLLWTRTLRWKAHSLVFWEADELHAAVRELVLDLNHARVDSVLVRLFIVVEYLGGRRVLWPARHCRTNDKLMGERGAWAQRVCCCVVTSAVVRVEVSQSRTCHTF
jgi:hypothetical protein